MIRDRFWVDGRATETPLVSAQDRGFTLGDGVFETMRLTCGTAFRLDAHLARLERGLQLLGIPAPPELRRWVVDAVREAGADDGRARLTVTRGIGPPGVLPAADPQPLVVIEIGARPTFAESVYEAGLSACVASGRRNERAYGAGIKTLGYTEAILALREAHRRGADDAIFLDTSGYCAEATAANLFIVRGSRLHTPPLSCGVLPGVTREVVLEIAAASRISIDESTFGRDELTTADEAFLTSSLRGIAPLVRIDGQMIGIGAPGSVTGELRARYEAVVARECRHGATT